MPKPPVRGDLEKNTEPLLQLGSTLGEGANGVVVEAEPASSSVPAEAELATSRLAVKMLRAGGGIADGIRGGVASGGGAHARITSNGRKEAMEAVMWEVSVLRELRGHAHIVKLHDVVELADSVVYVVMERVEGPDLQDYIGAQPGGVLAESTARLFFRHILAALRHAHGRGFLHCDLKPANVRLHEGRDGSMTAVLVDWGLARCIEQQPACLMMGTPMYAAPEQLTGYNADLAWGRAKLGPPADVWALGVTLYEMLTGRVPFSGTTHEALVANALRLNYVLNDVLSVGARQIIDSMLQVLPADRASVHELCIDPWTIIDGPMPPEMDSVHVDCEGGVNGGSTALSGAAKSTHQSWLSQCTERIKMYMGYAALVGAALWFGSAHGSWSQMATPMVQPEVGTH